MKKSNIIFMLCLVMMACKNDPNQATSLEESRDKSYSQNDGLITMKGEFVYYADAAVLQTKNDIYGVVIDKNMHTLADQVKPFKTEDTDMVPVMVRVRKFEKPKDEEGWPYRVEIKDILKVDAPATNKDDVIKLSN